MEKNEAWAEVAIRFATLVESIFLGLGHRLTPLNLLTSLAIIAILYGLRKPGKSFLQWAFPRKIYATSSFWVDVKVFFFNRLVGAFGLLNFGAMTGLIAVTVSGFFAAQIGSAAATPNIILVAGLLILASDFSYYVLHRVHHEWSFLWPLHSVHHSAEVLNPVTAYRHHPAFLILNAIYLSVFIGVIQGLILGLLFDEIDLLTIGGTNFFYALFNMAASNLRHTHIWLSFGRIVEHILISPAQHQIHHSTNPKHFNKNYGEVFAFWDWMFGSLYIPDGKEALQFGIANGKGERIKQPHPTWRRSLVLPLWQMWAMLRPAKSARQTAKEQPDK